MMLQNAIAIVVSLVVCSIILVALHFQKPVSRIGDIRCYSGNQLMYEGYNVKISRYNSETYDVVDKDSQVRIHGNCIVTLKN